MHKKIHYKLKEFVIAFGIVNVLQYATLDLT